jgi:shikimate kinase
MDERIGNNPKMKNFLEGVEGEDEAEKMGNAFGKPWEDAQKYLEQEAKFLQAEQEEMEKMIAEISTNPEKNFLVDLTGSAIYVPAIEKISQYGTVVYLKAGEEQYAQMQENFLADPKPVCWGEELLAQWQEAIDNGNPEKELPKLYAALLQYRHKHYEKYADTILEWDEHRGVCVEEILKKISV